MTIRFSNQFVAELIQPFWAAWQAREFMTEASGEAGTYRNRGLAWVRQAGGVRPRRGRDLQGRYLSFGEREEIALGLAGGESIRSIAGRLGRSASTIRRELARNSDAAGAYRATTAHPLAYERASRPKPARRVTNVALRARVEQDLERKHSPEQIAGRLRGDYPDDPEMWVSTETTLLCLSSGQLLSQSGCREQRAQLVELPLGALFHRRQHVFADVARKPLDERAVSGRSPPRRSRSPRRRRSRAPGVPTVGKQLDRQTCRNVMSDGYSLPSMSETIVSRTAPPGRKRVPAQPPQLVLKATVM